MTNISTNTKIRKSSHKFFICLFLAEIFAYFVIPDYAMIFRKPQFFRLGEFHVKDPDDYHESDYDPFGMESETWQLFYCIHERLSRKRRVVKLQKSYGRTPEEAARALGKATGLKWECISQLSYSQQLRRLAERKQKRKNARLKTKGDKSE